MSCIAPCTVNSTGFQLNSLKGKEREHDRRQSHLQGQVGVRSEKSREHPRVYGSFPKLDSTDFRYSAYVCDDRKTFVHLSMYKNENIQKKVLAVESFKAFQLQRDESGLEGPHTVEPMTLVASSFDLFN